MPRPKRSDVPRCPTCEQVLRRLPDREFVLARINEDDNGCWIWTGEPDPSGYGRSTGRAETVAHRLSYLTFVGPIPAGLHLDHLCRVRRCVNPEHLEPVTPRENVMRSTGLSAVNSRKTHCSRGHEFTPENTRIVRKSGSRSCKACEDWHQKRRRARERLEKGPDLPLRPGEALSIPCPKCHVGVGELCLSLNVRRRMDGDLYGQRIRRHPERAEAVRTTLKGMTQ